MLSGSLPNLQSAKHGLAAASCHLLEVLYCKSHNILKSLFLLLLWFNLFRVLGLYVNKDANHLWTALVKGLSKGRALRPRCIFIC